MIVSLSLSILTMRNAGSSGSVLERQKMTSLRPSREAKCDDQSRSAPAGQPIPLQLPPQPGKPAAQPAAPKK